MSATADSQSQVAPAAAVATLSASTSASAASGPTTSGFATVALTASGALSKPVSRILWLMCLAHFLHDMLQSLLSSIFPLLKEQYHLDFTQIGMIALCFQITASLLQPVVGWVTDKRALPWSLPVGLLATMGGLYLLATASTYPALLLAAAMVGTGSSVFHPEGSRVVRMAAGGRLGTAQSIFQVGGNFGQASGPLSAAFIIAPLGQKGILWFAGVALFTVALLAYVSRWYAANIASATRRARRAAAASVGVLSSAQVRLAIGVLLVLMFSKSVYTASLNTFYVFYLQEKFGLNMRDSQLCLFAYMAAVAAGVYFGGPIGDRFGRKAILWFSILGALPFTLLLPYADLWQSVVLSLVIGFIMSSSLSQIIVYAMELAPARTGMLAGLFLGLAFGFSGIAAVGLGRIADATSIATVYQICSFIPLIGLLTYFLPDVGEKRTTT